MTNGVGTPVTREVPGLGTPIYLDYNATTPVDPVVADEISAHVRGTFGNPSSGHAFGAAAHAVLAEARGRVADLLGAAPDEVVFTGGGSEGDNLAIKGIAFAQRDRGDHLITTAVEHPAVLNACRWLVERLGYRLTVLPVDGYGQIDPDAVARAIEPATVLVTVMHANNEVGTLNPIAEIAEICRQRGVPFHTDAAQSVGKVPTRVGDLGVDLLTIAGHKLYAPKGIGVLWVREGTILDSLVHGAGHERGRRAGTENVPYAAGLGLAATLCAERLESEPDRPRMLRNRLHTHLAELIAGLTLNGHPDERLPNTLNVSFPEVDAEELLASTPAVAAATGSACHAGRTEPSAVLTAMGIPAARALGAVRLTIGRWSTEEEMERAASLLAASWRALRQP
ncbi:MAG TPA: cysteine desulfurase family protein [Chloroflexota bacterium]|nr:cysteine desulfurase family protein [Chloroflexota bacterium]